MTITIPAGTVITRDEVNNRKPEVVKRARTIEQAHRLGDDYRFTVSTLHHRRGDVVISAKHYSVKASDVTVQE